MLTKCPKCKCDIESDSYYCDQCGAELYICPQCKTFGKGKRCTQCGTELVRASEYAGGAATQPAQPAPQPAAPVAAPTPQATTSPQPQPAPPQPAPQATSVPQPVTPTPQPTAQPAADKTIRPGAPMQPAAPQLQPGHIVCYAPQHIRLGLASGVIIGRRGHYPTVFGVYPDVSGNHARLDETAAGWTVTDLGSTNGTYLNGQMLQPNVPYPMHVGDTIRFSTLDFKVEV